MRSRRSPGELVQTMHKPSVLSARCSNTAWWLAFRFDFFVAFVQRVREREREGENRTEGIVEKSLNSQAAIDQNKVSRFTAKKALCKLLLPEARLNFVYTLRNSSKSHLETTSLTKFGKRRTLSEAALFLSGSLKTFEDFLKTSSQ